MSGRVFLDTNIIVYAHTDSDLLKQVKAQLLMTENEITISTQVLQETANTLKKKLKQSYLDISSVITDLITNNQIHTNTSETILMACDIARQYGFSFYDSLIISAALEAESEILYSEDMQHGRIIEKKLRIINPFI